ncbi:hypothetical protein ACQP2F_14390 [Actinoplanes sp. CA-030573]|uniref:hypothetical protein n=1 Tax=Actinoplanes sp. CA-030573 TaxID=3239898 RepID=UPI003D94104E
MSMFNSKPDKGVTGHSGNASGRGWTLTGTTRQLKCAIRNERTSPRKGDLAH